MSHKHNVLTVVAFGEEDTEKKWCAAPMYRCRLKNFDLDLETRNVLLFNKGEIMTEGEVWGIIIDCVRVRKLITKNINIKKLLKKGHNSVKII
jgi:hypothetical protein